jgi:hypothetical protein
MDMNEFVENADVAAFLDKMDRVGELLGTINARGTVPSVVFIGGQSFGKSTVVEMISGVKLPSGHGMVTKRPLSIQIRRMSNAKLTFKAREDAEEIPITENEISDMVANETARSDTEEAKIGNLSGVCDKTMTLRVEGPDKPNITLIDLPGINYTEGEDAIKQLIRGWVNDPAAIILVVHSAMGDTVNNEGFKLAKLADPTGKRIICLMTFVDLALGDPGLFQKNVVDLLNDTSRTFIAVKGPTVDEHTTISHAQARQQERNFFATSAWSSVSRESVSTGSLVTILVKRYFNAMKQAEIPLNEYIMTNRATTKKQIDLIPESVLPQQMFSELWASTTFQLMKSLEIGNVESDEPLPHYVSSIHHACMDQLDRVLMKVPTIILRGESEEASVKKLVSIVKSNDGITLPNFKPFPPLEGFFKKCAKTWFDKVAEDMVEHVHEILNDYIEVTVVKQQAHMDANESLGDVFNLLRSELRSAADEVSERTSVDLHAMSTRMANCMWTSNIHYYREILEKLRETRKARQGKIKGHLQQSLLRHYSGPKEPPIPAGWYETISNFIEEYDWEAFTGSDSELKESVIDYFFSFCAFWKVRIRAFVDIVGTCCLYDMISSFQKSIKARFTEIDENKLHSAFEVFKRLQRKRKSLIDRLATLEEAHRILLDGDLPYVPLSKKRRAELRLK